MCVLFFSLLTRSILFFYNPREVSEGERGGREREKNVERSSEFGVHELSSNWLRSVAEGVEVWLWPISFLSMRPGSCRIRRRGRGRSAVTF